MKEARNQVGSISHCLRQSVCIDASNNERGTRKKKNLFRFGMNFSWCYHFCNRLIQMISDRLIRPNLFFSEIILSSSL